MRNRGSVEVRDKGNEMGRVSEEVRVKRCVNGRGSRRINEW